MNLETSLAAALAATDANAVDLAHCRPFRLGPVEAVPAIRCLRAPSGAAATIQPLAMRVLIALAAANGATVSRDDLVQSCWNQRIVGDDAVHRIISKLRRDLAGLSESSVVIETIPKVGYRLRVAADACRDGVASSTVGSISHQLTRPWLAAALLAAGMVSAGIFAATGVREETAAIAVVADGGAGSGVSARFADGLTGDLARLASAMPSVAFVEPGGALAREPLLLRVALDTDSETPTARVRLVDSKDGAVVWSREFAAEGGSMGELRERVANGVTGVVQCGLDRAAAFDDPVGLRLYLGACEGLQTGDFARARTFAQQITAFKPDAPAGWACLANTTIFAAADKGSVDEATLARAESYARRALEADPTSGLAYVALAMAKSWRGEPMLATLEQGLRADPDFAMLHKHYALALGGAGMVAQAVDPALRAVALQPHERAHFRIAVNALVNAGRTDEAIALSERSRRIWRFDRDVALQRIELLPLAQDPKAALAALSASSFREERRAGLVRHALLWRADPAGYDWSAFDRFADEAHAANTATAWAIALTAARMGDTARALAWLDRAPVTGSPIWSPLFAPEAAALRRDPRFFAKMAAVGLVARWQKSGRWPDFCADPALTYDCRGSAARLARRSQS